MQALFLDTHGFQNANSGSEAKVFLQEPVFASSYISDYILLGLLSCMYYLLRLKAFYRIASHG